MAISMYNNEIVVNHHTKNKLFSIFWFIFFLTVIFPPMFLKIDVRIFLSLFWLIVARKVAKPSKVFVIIVFLAVYSSLVILINTLQGRIVDFGIALRFIRACVMVLTISSMIKHLTKYNQKGLLLSSLCLLLTIHSSIIILEIIFPNIKNFMYIFSGESKIFYQFRANGFVNSYDFAGMYSNIGMVLAAFLFSNKKKIFIIFFIICAIGAVFTSRTNLVFCGMTLIYLRVILQKNKLLLAILINILIVSLGVIAIIMWAITTDLMEGARSFLFKKYDWMYSFYSIIRNTYSDNILSDVITSQFYITGESVIKFFGTGNDPNRDPGYVQMLYSIGIIGSLISIVPLIIMFYQKFQFDRSKRYFNDPFRFIASNLLGYVLLLEVFMNIKILVLFSTGAFEILIVIYEIFNKKQK